MFILKCIQLSVEYALDNKINSNAYYPIVRLLAS